MSINALGVRLAAACALLYPITLIVGDDVIAKGDKLAPDAGSPSEVAANVADASSTFFYGRAFGLLSALMLIVFAAYAASRLRQSRGATSVWASLALAGGVVAAGLQLNSAVAQLSLVRHDGGGADPDLQVALLDLGFGFPMMMLPLALLVGAIAVDGVSGSGHLVGKGIGWIGVVLAPALVLGFVFSVGEGAGLGFLALLLTWVWFLAVGVAALRRTARVVPVSPRSRPATAVTAQ